MLNYEFCCIHTKTDMMKLAGNSSRKEEGCVLIKALKTFWTINLGVSHKMHNKNICSILSLILSRVHLKYLQLLNGPKQSQQCSNTSFPDITSQIMADQMWPMNNIQCNGIVTANLWHKTTYFWTRNSAQFCNTMTQLQMFELEWVVPCPFKCPH